MAVHRCTSCEATFTQLRRLRRHQRVHRRFQCRHCTEKFSSRQARDDHLSKHVQSVGTQTDHQAKLRCRLLTPTIHRRKVQEYNESGESRRAREKAREMDPLGLRQKGRASQRLVAAPSLYST